MSEATISILKNHLPEFVHQAEKGEDIQITRHGKAVAVIVSLERYNQAFGSGRGVFSAYTKWRERHPEGGGFTDQELDDMRSREPYPENDSVWK